MNNIQKYLGFAIKSGSIVVGQDKIKDYDKRMYLIIVSSTATQNLLDLSKRVASRQHVPLILVQDLENVSHLSYCKIIAITNKNLSDSILLQTDEFTNLGETI